MRKLVLVVLNTIALLAVGTMAFAADIDGYAIGLSTIGMTIGIAIASAGCGYAQSVAIKAACEGTSRNPEAGGQISQSLILGLAFIESLCIYALLVNLILLFANPFLG